MGSARSKSLWTEYMSVYSHGREVREEIIEPFLFPIHKVLCCERLLIRSNEGYRTPQELNVILQGRIHADCSVPVHCPPSVYIDGKHVIAYPNTPILKLPLGSNVDGFELRLHKRQDCGCLLFVVVWAGEQRSSFCFKIVV